ncbi:hypothetical protein HHK36_028547 [Tetracentron sinense]|uniref:Fe2OG dioxygenase domain-containing protein n=1 Tax=Tetracentron sinense TaxID=13715 RepID=A0A834YB84_TETSI|nr:hypothetical protein HHK36_028547 [Tetracentron sinense]
MESKVMNRLDNLGGSLPVENVQELASRMFKDIPARYIRPEVESDVVSVDESLKIPVIDLNKLLHHQFCHGELAKLHSACQDWGFFQLTNHGVSEEVIENMKVDTEEFFRLPLEEKKAYSQLQNNIEGYGQAFVVSKDQKLDWGDMLFLLPQPVARRKFRFWPNYPTSFRATLDKYSSELQRLTICLLGLMAKNLGLDPKKLANMFEGGTQGVRMNYYPPCTHADKVLGISPHSDATGLTLLIQANETQGLQIKKNGNWVPIKPISGAFIVNIGDVIEIMSNGNYKSIEHRAVINPEKERLSIAAFHSPNMSTTIGPLPDLVKEEGAIYKSVSHENYTRLVITMKLDGKSLLDDLKLE